MSTTAGKQVHSFIMFHIPGPENQDTILRSLVLETMISFGKSTKNDNRTPIQHVQWSRVPENPGYPTCEVGPVHLMFVFLFFLSFPSLSLSLSFEYTCIWCLYIYVYVNVLCLYMYTYVNVYMYSVLWLYMYLLHASIEFHRNHWWRLADSMIS